MGATYVGVRRAHPYSWLLSSPQQPLETEDPPTVSLAPQYTSQCLCRAILFFATAELSPIAERNAVERRLGGSFARRSTRKRCRFFKGRRVEISVSGADRTFDRVRD